MALSQYITDQTFEWVLEDLNYECSPQKKLDLIQRAVGSMESELSSKFVVPLVNRISNTWQGSPPNAQAQVLNCLKAKIRAIIGIDKNRNLAAGNSTEKFQNLHEEEFKGIIKSLLNYEIDYGFLLQKQAQNAKEPVQAMGLARSKVNRETGDDGCGGRF